jgi:alkylation response protein AidB-like acyl-CoA dehydrogenase
LIARTSSDGPKHSGISLFILPLDTDGVTVRPLRETTGECHFNETFFDGVRVPRENLIGELRRGWALAKITLANERMNLTHGGACWARARVPMTCSTSFEQAAASMMPRYANDSPAAGRRRRSWRSSTGGCFGHSLPDASPARSSRFAKALAGKDGQRLTEDAKSSGDIAGLLEDTGPLETPVGRWHWGHLFSRALTIGGGTSVRL